MRADLSQDQVARLTLSPGETLYYRPGLQRSQALEMPLRPPWPRGAPLARALHGAYWLARAQAQDREEVVELVSDALCGHFVFLELRDKQEVALRIEDLAAVSLVGARGGRLITGWRSFLRPAYWAWGQPVTSLARGPGWLLLHGQALREASSQEPTLHLGQVRAFDTGLDLEVAPLQARGVLAMLRNVTTFESRLLRHEPGLVVIQSFQPPRRRRRTLWKRFVLHLLWSAVVLGLVWWLLL